jgi:hypothetical protein
VRTSWEGVEAGDATPLRFVLRRPRLLLLLLAAQLQVRARAAKTLVSLPSRLLEIVRAFAPCRVAVVVELGAECVSGQRKLSLGFLGFLGRARGSLAPSARVEYSCEARVSEFRGGFLGCATAGCRPNPAIFGPNGLGFGCGSRGPWRRAAAVPWSVSCDCVVPCAIACCLR